jgi:hypothetical protein
VEVLEPLEDLSAEEMANLTAAREQAALDCEVSEWSEWSACTNTASSASGKTTLMHTRTREVITPASEGGEPCPDLVQTESC